LPFRVHADQIIEDEHRIWKQWKQSHEREQPDINVKNNEFFKMIRVNLASPDLIPNVLMTSSMNQPTFA
jgi:hypothetical protein